MFSGKYTRMIVGLLCGIVAVRCRVRVSDVDFVRPRIPAGEATLTPATALLGTGHRSVDSALLPWISN